MLRRIFQRCVIYLVAICLVSVWMNVPANAAAIDPYVARYLKATEPVELAWDNQGHTRSFSAIALSQGKRLFEQNCLNCHVGGSTLPNPLVPLSLTALQGATPRRDAIASLVQYIRQPMTYDGREESFICQKVSESWMSTDAVEHLAAFILRAAQKAPGWGTETFQ